jgi:hypothetical protein
MEKEVPELFQSRGPHPQYGEWGTWRGTAGNERLVSTKHIPTKTRCVCKACNTGWMSNLEELSKPLLVGMMKGRNRTLYLVSQRIVATWAYKTALMLGEAQMSRNDPLRAVFPATHYQHVFRYAEPPQQACVQLFRYDGDQVHKAFRETTRLVPIKQNPGVFGVVYALTLLAGNLVFVITGYYSVDERWSVKRLKVTSLKNQANTVAVTIWPPPLEPSIVWPPTETIDNTGFRRFGNDLAAAIQAI